MIVVTATSHVHQQLHWFRFHFKFFRTLMKFFPCNVNDYGNQTDH